MGTIAALVAHQGGWDEAVLVALPLVVLVALLRMARRRALKEAAEDDHVAEDAPPRSSDPGPAADR